MDGILNIYKTTGMTSFDVVSRIRKLCQTKKVGHAGTLDPDASGVLPVCVGKATKVIEFLMDKTKAYRVGLLLGAATDTQDSSGEVLYEKPVRVSQEDIENTIKSFLGETTQIPPMYSAIRVNGQRLYELARKGVEVDRKPRPVNFLSLEILSINRENDKVRVIFDVECSKGTYMRTLCHDIGEKLGCGGHMASLLRTRSGPFSIDNAYKLDELEEKKDTNMLDSILIPMDFALNSLPSVMVSHSDAKRLKNGLNLLIYALLSGFVRVYHESGCFIAIGKVLTTENDTELRIHKWIGDQSIGL